MRLAVCLLFLLQVPPDIELLYHRWCLTNPRLCTLPTPREQWQQAQLERAAIEERRWWKRAKDFRRAFEQVIEDRREHKISIENLEAARKAWAKWEELWNEK